MNDIEPSKTMEKYFADEEPEFFQFMIDQGFFENPKTYKDYLSRIRYVSSFFRIDKTLDKNKLKEIRQYLVDTKDSRDSYCSSKNISDIMSGLNKFLLYVNSDYQKSMENEITQKVSAIHNDTSLSETEKEVLLKARIGQGRFRQMLIEYWKGCSVTQCDKYPLLVASHIKPWRKADNGQRIDAYNGLLLTPNIDKLFDRGYITFDKKGMIVCSKRIGKEDKQIFGINDYTQLIKVEDRHLPYLKYHQDNCFLG